jgi:dTDP-4-amino-4,6-dideoxygalactose transaminase
MITVNNPKYVKRAEIIREKGTNRSAFFRGEVNKYGWVDIGSSFLPSEIIAAFLYAQLENLDHIQQKRKQIWNTYHEGLAHLEQAGKFLRPEIPGYATNNAHMYFIVCRSLKERSALIEYLKENEILSVFHYLSLHKSPFYKKIHDGRKLPHSDRFTNCLLRLPLYFELSAEDQSKVIDAINSFYRK